MGNIVGSRDTIHWHKKWIPIKASLHLNRRQRALIIGSLLGDGAMRVGKGSVNANFKVEHGLRQKAYVLWKYRILRPFVFTGPRISHRYHKNGGRYTKSWWFRTVRHPELTAIYRQFYAGNGYRCGRKMVPKRLKTELTPLALATWIMDDGTRLKGTTEVSTYAFTKSEVRQLSELIQEKFGITTRLVRDRDKGYRLFFNKRETRKLIALIREYVLPSLRYKIGTRPRND